MIFIFLTIFFQTLCEFKIFDGSKLKDLSYSPNEDYNPEEKVSIENFSQEMISYYSWFASYGCCEDVDVPLFCCKSFIDFFTKKWTIVSESSTEKFFVYNYILWRSDEYKKYIIAFPGTNSILELLSEGLNIKLVDYEDKENGIKVVNYFKQLAFELKQLIFSTEILKDINEHPGYQFIATGHSLGASVATIILYEAVSKRFLDPTINEPVLISFAQPRTGNEDFVIDFNEKIKNVIRIVRDGDIIVSIPYSLINNPYRHIKGLILVNKDMNTMTYCPKDIGEDYPDKECQKTTSINLNYHSYYFNPDTKFSERCQLN